MLYWYRSYRYWSYRYRAIWKNLYRFFIGTSDKKIPFIGLYRYRPIWKKAYRSYTGQNLDKRHFSKMALEKKIHPSYHQQQTKYFWAKIRPEKFGGQIMHHYLGMYVHSLCSSLLHMHKVIVVIFQLAHLFLNEFFWSSDK